MLHLLGSSHFVTHRLSRIVVLVLGVQTLYISGGVLGELRYWGVGLPTPAHIPFTSWSFHHIAGVLFLKLFPLPLPPRPLLPLSRGVFPRPLEGAWERIGLVVSSSGNRLGNGQSGVGWLVDLHPLQCSMWKGLPHPFSTRYTVIVLR